MTALQKIEDIALYNNESIREMEAQMKQMNEMLEIWEITGIHILEPHRCLIKKGTLQYSRTARSQTSDLKLWLFNDLIVYGQQLPLQNFSSLKMTRNVSSRFSFKDIPLLSCHVYSSLDEYRGEGNDEPLNEIAEGEEDDCPSPIDPSKSPSLRITNEVAEKRNSKQIDENAFLLESSQDTFLVIAASYEEKMEWLASIQEAQQSRQSCERHLEKADSNLLAPFWQPDISPICEICSISFTLFNRRHHCRACGRLVCHSCSPNSVLLKEFATYETSCTSQNSRSSTERCRVCCLCLKYLETIIPQSEKNSPAIIEPHDLQVLLISCSDLAKADLFSLSDPYVILNFQQFQYRSKMIPDNLNPVWNESFLFPYYRSGEDDSNFTLKLTVYDYDYLKADGKNNFSTAFIPCRPTRNHIY